MGKKKRELEEDRKRREGLKKEIRVKQNNLYLGVNLRFYLGEVRKKVPIKKMKKGKKVERNEETAIIKKKATSERCEEGLQTTPG